LADVNAIYDDLFIILKLRHCIGLLLIMDHPVHKSG